MAKIQSSVPVSVLHNDLHGLNLGDYLHLTAAEKAKFDNLNDLMHTIGNESFTGIKSSINTGASQINGFILTNNGTGFNSQVIRVNNNSTGLGILTDNQGTGYGIYANNGGLGYGIASYNYSNGIGIQNYNQTGGIGLVLDASPVATNYLFQGRSNGTPTSSLTKAGDFTANSFIKSGGTSSQFLKADGSVDTNTYLLSSDNHWTKTGNNILNNNTGIVILRGGAGGIYDTVLRTQYLNGATWMDSNFRVDNGGNVEASNVTVYGGVLLPANGGFLACDGDGTNYIKGYRDDRWVSDIKFKYLTDLSATYDDRTLIDKGYLDSRITSLSSFVPYTGATSNVNLGEYGISTGNIQFDLTPTQPLSEGQLRWNDIDGTLEFMMKGGNVTQQIGQELPILVKHADNTGLTNGYVVYTVGSDGTNNTVRYAIATSDLTSSTTFGVMTEDAAGGAKAFCTTFGMVRGINTLALVEGSAVWLSPTVAGGLTTTKPIAPDHSVYIGVCVRSHATEGAIFVNISNGYELGELHDVLVPTPSNNDILTYESFTSLWKNKSIPTVLGYTPANDANVVHITGGETITGQKKFFGDIVMNSSVLLDQSTSVSAAPGYTSMYGISDGFGIYDGTSNKTINLKTTNVVGTRTFQLPNADGTIALTSNLSSYQPLLSGTGFVKSTAGVISYDTSTYLTTISGIAAGGELSGTYPNPTLLNSAVTGKVLTGVNITGGSVSATDSILTAFGKLQNQVNSLVGGTIYQSTWNASTNSPTLTTSVGTKGYYYIVSVAGSTNLNGITDWKVGDWAIYDGASWQKVDNTDAVSSVNGFTGAVSLTTANISEVTNLYYTDARSRSAISLTTTGSSGASAYNSATGVLNVPTYTLAGLGGQPLLTNPITGTGTTNYLPKFTGSTSLGNSLIYDNGTNLGIGTTSPSALFQVNSSSSDPVLISNTGANSYNSLILSNNNNYKVAIGIGGSSVGGNLQNNGFIGTISNKDFILNTNNTERIRITSGGNVLIGTTTDNGNKLRVNGSGYFDSSVTASNFLSTYGVGVNNILLGNSSDMGGNTFPLSIAAPAGTTAWPFGIIKAGTPIFRINTSGDLLSAGAATFASSVSADGGFSTPLSNGYYINGGRFVYHDGTTYLGNIDNLSPGSSTIIRSGGINALTLTSTGAATFNSTVASNSSISSTYIVAGYATKNSTNYSSKYIGTVGDFNRFVILLHPVYNGTLIAWHECDGVFTKRRGGTGTGVNIGSYKVQTKTGYNSVGYSLVSSIGGNGDLYTCTYNGVKYVCLVPDYNVSGQEYGFDGYISGDANSLLIVPYFNSNTSAVLNAEINSSLTIIPGSSQSTTNFKGTVTASTFIGDLTGHASLDLPLTGGTLSGNLALSSMSAIDGMIENAYGAYFHLGGWGVARTAATAVLVNTAYMADVLSTARTINGVSFNGSANITVADSTKLPLAGGTMTGGIYVGTFPSSVVNSGSALLGKGSDRANGTMTVQLGNVTSSVFEVVDKDWTTVVLSAGMTSFSYKGNNILHAGNYNTYSPTLTGTGASGTWGINISGYAESVQANPNRTDGTAYPVLWSNGNAQSPTYSCAAVTIQSSTGTLQATTLRATADVIAYYSSDRRFKDNITPISNALEKVKSLGGYEFDWNDTQETHTGHDIGLIAQEVELIFPEIVANREDGFKSVKYERLIPVFVEAIKEQQEQIEELKSLVKALTANS